MTVDRLTHGPSFKRPIPKNYTDVGGYQEIPIVENDELLVPIGPFSKYREIYTDSIYFGERLSSPYRDKPVEGSNLTIFVRESLAEQLRLMQKYLPSGVYVLVYDGYRTLEAQKNLYYRYMTELAIKEPRLTTDQLVERTKLNMPEPSADPQSPSTHLTGGSVDLSLLHLSPVHDAELRKIDKELDGLTPSEAGRAFNLEIQRALLMGEFADQLEFPTNFNSGDTKAGLTFLEEERKKRELTNTERLALRNTRMLEAVSAFVGLRALRSEWWHKNSEKTQMGAKVAGLPIAEFGPILELSEENLRHEEMRRAYLSQTPGWEKTKVPQAEIILP